MPGRYNQEVGQTIPVFAFLGAMGGLGLLRVGRSTRLRAGRSGGSPG